VEELTASSIWAVEILVELLAHLGLVVLGHVRLLLELVVTMSKAAGGLEFAEASVHPVLAHLGLKLCFKAFDIFAHFLL